MRPGSSGSEDILAVWQSMKGGITCCTTCGGITEGCLEVHPTLTMPLLALQGRKVMQMMVGTPKAAQQQDSSSSRSSTITTLPAPTDPAVRLAVSGGEVVAVMPFEGYITPEAAASVRQQLAKALEKGEEEGDGAGDVMSATVTAACYSRCPNNVLSIQAAGILLAAAVQSSGRCVI